MKVKKIFNIVFQQLSRHTRKVICYLAVTVTFEHIPQILHEYCRCFRVTVGDSMHIVHWGIFSISKCTIVCGIHVCRDWFEFCGYAFCERLNPPLSNDAFMLSVSSSPSLSLPSSLSTLIKRMALYASDIKRHQSPHTVYLRCFLSFVLLFRAFFCFLAHTLPVCRRRLMWSFGKQWVCALASIHCGIVHV